MPEERNLRTTLSGPRAAENCANGAAARGSAGQHNTRSEPSSCPPTCTRNETTKAPLRLHVDGEAAHLAASTGTAHEPNAEESNAVRGRVDELPRGRHAAKRHGRHVRQRPTKSTHECATSQTEVGTSRRQCNDVRDGPHARTGDSLARPDRHHRTMTATSSHSNHRRPKIQTKAPGPDASLQSGRRTTRARSWSRAVEPARGPTRRQSTKQVAIIARR